MQTLRTFMLKLSNSGKYSHRGSDTEVAEWMIPFLDESKGNTCYRWGMESSAGGKE